MPKSNKGQASSGGGEQTNNVHNQNIFPHNLEHMYNKEEKKWLKKKTSDQRKGEHTTAERPITRPLFDTWQSMKIHTMTWNVNAAEPRSVFSNTQKEKRLVEILEQFSKKADDGDLVLIGLQEIIETTVAFSRDSKTKDETKKWAMEIPRRVDRLHLLPKGAKYHGCGVALLIYECRPNNIGAFLYECGTPFVVLHKTGIVNMGQAKGTVFCDITFVGNRSSVKTITVCVSHLPAYGYMINRPKNTSEQGRYAAAPVRLSCMKKVGEIMEKNMQTNKTQGIIWMGDFNFGLKEQPPTNNGEWAMPKTGEWLLSNNDEFMLLEETDSNTFMKKLKEAPITFGSTYKMRKNNNESSTGYAWTDRILYNFGDNDNTEKFSEGLSTDGGVGIYGETYTTLPNKDHVQIISDHSPVVATFNWYFHGEDSPHEQLEFTEATAVKKTLKTQPPQVLRKPSRV